MATITKKICLIGDFGVGKTSTVARFIKQSFSDKYLTTVGVKVDTKLVTLDDGREVKFVIWDIAGTDAATPVYKNYLRGAAGYLLVTDGTRAYTLDNAMGLKGSVDELLDTPPFVGLINKVDLKDKWEIPDSRIDELRALQQTWLTTSAKSGDNVEEAFAQLARQLLG